LIWQQESKYVGVDVYNIIVILVNSMHLFLVFIVEIEP